MLKLIRFVIKLLSVGSINVAGKFALYLFSKPIRLKQHPKDIHLLQEAKEDSFLINGKRVVFRTWGEGNPVILAHGWSGKGMQFHRFIQSLSELGYQVVVPNFPAHVDSGGTTTTAIEFSLTIDELLIRFPACRIIIAHSLGGLGSMLSLQKGSQVEKLVTICTPASAKEIASNFAAFLGGGEKLERAFVQKAKDKFNVNFYDFSAEEIVKDLRGKLDMLIIGDRADQEVSWRDAERIAQNGDGELFLTDELGHNAILRNEAVINKVIDFMRA